MSYDVLIHLGDDPYEPPDDLLDVGFRGRHIHWSSLPVSCPPSPCLEEDSG